MASPNKPLKKPSQSSLCTTLFFTVLFTIPSLFLLRTSSSTLCSSTSTAAGSPQWSGDLRDARFSWNRLSLAADRPPPVTLKIAVFSRKWPMGSTPGGMERHAHTLHTALARRGHRVHVFTSPFTLDQDTNNTLSQEFPRIHCHGGAEAGRWRYNMAWKQFQEENRSELFDVIHSESVALPHWLAREVPNLAVSWHGIALESLQSRIYQDLARKQDEPRSPDFNASLYGILPKILNEIRFFHSYSHHVAISDSCGEMLRDVYQIPRKRVHVILNGVDENGFSPNSKSRQEFRSQMGIPINDSIIVLGVAGRLVKDKGHPLLHEAFSKFAQKFPHVYLVVAGSGPWQNRYKDLGSNVIILGSLNPSQLKFFYNGIDIFVNPTLRPQGLDLTLMEAMLSGKPVMASRFPSIKGSIVINEEFGFMFSPNVEDLTVALEAAVVEGAERLAERGRRCREYAAEMFTATKMALAYERLFLCIKDERFCKYP